MWGFSSALFLFLACYIRTAAAMWKQQGNTAADRPCMQLIHSSLSSLRSMHKVTSRVTPPHAGTLTDFASGPEGISVLRTRALRGQRRSARSRQRPRQLQTQSVRRAAASRPLLSAAPMCALADSHMPCILTVPLTAISQ